MPRFSPFSAANLETCHEDLIILFEDVIEAYDCSVLCGERNEIDQTAAYNAGRSKVQWPNGKHNDRPSEAIDASPYPIPERWGAIDWQADTARIRHTMKELHRFYHFAGFVLGTAAGRGISIRWGGDWDSDRSFTDQAFDDLVHFELL